MFYKKVIHIYDNQGNRMSFDSLLKGEYCDTILRPALINEWGKRAQESDTGL